MTVSSEMKKQDRSAIKSLAFALSLVVYCAGLLYAGVRSYSLFAATIAPDLLPLAILGIVALELSAVGLPLALHFWTAPGAQRMAAMGFYLLDLALVVGNSILDAAHHSGTVLPEFIQAYGVYAVPALPVLCMGGWALVWMLDPASRQHDMEQAVKTATHNALLGQLMRAAGEVDITQAVAAAANEAARALVAETLGSAPRRQAPSAPQAQTPVELPAPGRDESQNTVQSALPGIPETVPELLEPIRARRNGHSKPAQADAGPK